MAADTPPAGEGQPLQRTRSYNLEHLGCSDDDRGFSVRRRGISNLKPANGPVEAPPMERFDVSVSDQAVVSTSEAESVKNLALGTKNPSRLKWSLKQGETVSLSMLPAEGRRLSGGNLPLPLMRQPTLDSTHRRALKELLRPLDWQPSDDRSFVLTAKEIEELCDQAEAIISAEPSCLKLQAPVKVFGDLHGQYGDLMRLFAAYGTPSKLESNGDISGYDYLFLGDYVDRGSHSLEVVCLLLALKIESPKNIHILRGNHEAASVNCMFGLMSECCERLGQEAGSRVWSRINSVFDWLPLGAVVADRILCVHGGIGQLVRSIADIENVSRPCSVDLDGPPSVVKDLLWSDPTPHDAVEGIIGSRRGPGVCAFGPDQVTDFCSRNNIDLILRAHECVMDGIERFAGGRLMTIFSAVNYCGTMCNSGAMVVISRDLEVLPKLLKCSEGSSRCEGKNSARVFDESPTSAMAQEPVSVLSPLGSVDSSPSNSPRAAKQRKEAQDFATFGRSRLSLPFTEFSD